MINYSLVVPQNYLSNCWLGIFFQAEMRSTVSASQGTKDVVQGHQFREVSEWENCPKVVEAAVSETRSVRI